MSKSAHQKKKDPKNESYIIGPARQAIPTETITNCWKKLNVPDNHVDFDLTTSYSDLDAVASELIHRGR